MREGWFAFIPIERRMLIRWCWNAEAFATDEHGISRKRQKQKISDGKKTYLSEPDA